MFSLTRITRGQPGSTTVEVHNPSGVASVDGHQVEFVVHVTVTWPGEALIVLSQVVMDIGAVKEVDTGSMAEDRATPVSRLERVPVGQCTMRNPGFLPFHTGTSGGRCGFVMTLLLNDSQLEQLESLRGGSDLRFWPSLALQISGLPGEERQSVRQEFNGLHIVPQSEWIDKVLTRLECDRRLLIEVRLASEGGDEGLLHQSTEAMVHARRLVARGRLSEAVQGCLAGLDQLTAAVGLTPEDEAELARRVVGSGSDSPSEERAFRVASLRHTLRELLRSVITSSMERSLEPTDAADALALTAAVMGASRRLNGADAQRGLEEVKSRRHEPEMP
jgi:hypothetical protein